MANGWSSVFCCAAGIDRAFAIIPINPRVMGKVIDMDEVEGVTVTTVRWMAIALLVAGLVPFGGCRICADCEDLAYPAYGGAWQRTRRDEGRVGSLFDPGGAKTSELVSRDTPTDPDELERARQKARAGEGSDVEDRKEQDSEVKPDLEEKGNDLRDRKLEDIDDREGDELRKKDLQDIDVHIIPGEQLPPLLR